MKVLLYVALYIVIGFVLAILISRVITNDRGYSVHSFGDLDDDEQSLIACTFIIWPVMIVFFAIYFVLNYITIITNRGGEE